MPAKSFCVPAPARGSAAESLRRGLAEARRAVASPAAGLVFVTGTLVAERDRLAEVVRETWPGVPAVVVPGAAVASDQGELERASAATGVLWSGERAEAFRLGEGSAVGRPVFEPAPAGRLATVLLFGDPETFAPTALDAFVGPDAPLVLGAGAVGAGPVALGRDGAAIAGPAVGLALAGPARPRHFAAPGCRLLGDFETIDEAQRGLVLRVGGRPALDALSRASAKIAHGPDPRLVLGALAAQTPDEDGRTAWVVRPVRGVDPTRRGLLLGSDAVPGARLAFAYRDAPAAREGFVRATTRLAEALHGAAPRFALLFTCTGRGQGLYGVADAEVKMLRQRFGDLPLAGLQSSFEIAPAGGDPPYVQLFTAVVSVFHAPS